MTLWEKIKICNLAKFQNLGQLQLRPRSAPQRAEKQNRENGLDAVYGLA